jgi:hypothetical protein
MVSYQLSTWQVTFPLYVPLNGLCFPYQLLIQPDVLYVFFVNTHDKLLQFFNSELPSGNLLHSY